MDIYHLKNDITNKLQSIIDEYSRNEECNLQRIAEIDLKLRTNIDTIRDQENQISLLGKKNQDLEKANHDFSLLINDLQEKILVLEEVKRQEDRFDIVRVQANDIHQKDLEIERLQKLLKKDKSPKSQQQPIETLIQSVETKSIEIKKEDKEWTLLTTKNAHSLIEDFCKKNDINPRVTDLEKMMYRSGYSFCDLTTKQQIEIIDDIVLANQDIFGKLTESEENIIQDRINKKIEEGSYANKDEKEESEKTESDDEGEEVESIMYKKKEYYYIVGEKEKYVYEILEDDELGPVFGKWKDVKGKKRVVPN